MLTVYRHLLSLSWPVLNVLLKKRIKQNKEDPARINERKGQASIQRPNGPLVWVHAASIGEAQSALILIDRILQSNKNTHILVTTGTLTSAQLMGSKLPGRAVHQFYPLDYPKWVRRFLEHWKPDLILWMESELWPNMLTAIKSQNIPTVLINARLSDRSFKRWTRFKSTIKEMLGTFGLILTQTEQDRERFLKLGAQNVEAVDNLKYSAAPLPFDQEALKSLSDSVHNRPIWLFSSTHDGEEEMACRVHRALKKKYDSVLTIIVPRHPDRRDNIKETCTNYGLHTTLRGNKKILPSAKTDVYIADTLGELGLFYTMSPLACIGRSFSRDGGGGHNPIEAAQLNCAVLYGPNVQFQKQIYNDMEKAEAAIQVYTEEDLKEKIKEFLDDPNLLKAQQERGLAFARQKEAVINRVLEHIESVLQKALK